MKTVAFDPADFLDNEDQRSEYLRMACEDGSAAEIALALGAIARARGMGALAEEAGLSRPSLYKALQAGGNPSFDTIVRVAKALGYTIAFAKDQAA
jgi:probable addiction module antidote protein